MLKVFTLLFVFCLLCAHITFAQAGLLDTSFGNNGIVKTDIAHANDYGFSTVVQPDGKIIVVGIAMVDTFEYNNFVVIRYKTNGSFDSTFGTNGIVTTDFGGASDEALSVCLQPDGKIVVAGKSSSVSNMIDFAIARYNMDGSLDNTFDGDGKVTTDLAGENDYGSCVKMQSDGKIVLAGYSGTATNNKLTVVRYNTNGSLDSTFDVDGIATAQVGYIYLDGQSLAIQSDGKIVATASTATTSMLNDLNYLVVRFKSNGSLDSTFDADGIVITEVCYSDHAYSVAIQSDGKIVVAGSSYDTINISMGLNVSMVRYHSNGSLDNTFGINGKVHTEVTPQADRAFSISLQSNGKIIIAGHGFDGVSYFKIILVRYLNDGNLDNSFGIDGIVTTNIASKHEFGESIAIQNDGKIVVTGFINDGMTFDIFVARYIGDVPYPSSISNTLSETAITLSPNPFSTELVLHSEMNLSNASLSLYNVFGQKVKEISFINIEAGKSITIHRDNLADGIYFLNVTSNGKLLFKEKVLIINK